jgi:DNA-binding NtrC family response regulator
MWDMTTLVTGPSGTGKELVARAIGLARYIPFDEKTGAFAENFASSFHPLNLSALSSTLIESELFGHCRGSFTGAVAHRAGWLESCGQYGTVFLDEIGELDAQIQVKLLRVLQTRTFNRLGESSVRRFRGKIIAATNRDVAGEMAAGRFREDLYYRLCSDLISTPSLHEQLAEDPGELLHLIRFVARQFAPGEAEPLAREVLGWVHQHLGDDYGWPGNFRELEQCVRNVLIRGEYRPLRKMAGSSRDRLADDFLAGSMSADDLLRSYCTIVYAQTGSYVETASRIGVDRRTVRGKVDRELLARLKA